MFGGQDVTGEPGKPSLEGTRLKGRDCENNDPVVPGLLAGAARLGLSLPRTWQSWALPLSVCKALSTNFP